MVLNKKYQSQAAAISSFDWEDIASGTGFQRVYGMRAKTSTGEGWRLTSDTNFSHSEFTTAWLGIDKLWNQPDDGTFTKRIDLDFDLSAFNTPRIIRGTAQVQQGFYWDIISGTMLVYMIYTLIRVRGGVAGTETTIGTVQSEDYTISTNDKYGVISMPISLTETTIKKGDILRLTVEGWSKMSSSGTGKCYVGVDPKDRDGTKITPSTQKGTSSLILDIPFDIDV